MNVVFSFVLAIINAVIWFSLAIERWQINRIKKTIRTYDDFLRNLQEESVEESAQNQIEDSPVSRD